MATAKKATTAAPKSPQASVPQQPPGNESNHSGSPLLRTAYTRESDVLQLARVPASVETQGVDVIEDTINEIEIDGVTHRLAALNGEAVLQEVSQ